MSCFFTSHADPGATPVRLSNGLTAVVFDVLALAGSELACSERETLLVYWLIQHDQTRIGVGCAGFDLSDLGWTAASFEADQRFLLAVIDAALAQRGWERMPFKPGHGVLPALGELRALVARFPPSALAGTPPAEDAWRPEELPALGRCEVHRVFLHDLGCIVCNDAPLDAPPDARPHSTVHGHG